MWYGIILTGLKNKNKEAIMEFYSEKKKIEFTDAMKDYLTEKMDKLRKFVKDVDGRATLKKEGHLLKLEIAIPGNIRASHSGGDYYALVIEVISQLERQIRKYRTARMKHRNKTKLAFNILEVQEEREMDTVDEDINTGAIVREKFIPVETIDRDQAIEEMELLGHSFFVFRDILNNQISVVYKREDKNYGILVIPE
jgi:putative sigma-54 modulation protein